MFKSSSFWLFAGPSLIWGFTWFAITFQIQEIAPLQSVFYRFILATAIIYSYCKYKGYSILFDVKTNLLLAFLGFSNYSINYWLVYLAEIHLTSGLVAVMFGLLLFFNMLFGKIFLGNPLRTQVLLAGLIGIAGTTLIFHDDIFIKDNNKSSFIALGYVFCSVILASLGNIAAARLSQKKLNIIQINTVGMMYGTLILFLLVMFRNESMIFSIKPSFILSLLYLSVFGSVIAFNLYLKLMVTVGPDKAAYTQIIIPIVAMLASTFFENYQWTIWSIAGVSLVIVGNWLVFGRK